MCDSGIFIYVKIYLYVDVNENYKIYLYMRDGVTYTFTPGRNSEGNRNLINT